MTSNFPKPLENTVDDLNKKTFGIFYRTNREDNFLAVKHGNYTVDRDEIMGEALDWTMQYLQYM